MSDRFLRERLRDQVIAGDRDFVSSQVRKRVGLRLGTRVDDHPPAFGIPALLESINGGDPPPVGPRRGYSAVSSRVSRRMHARIVESKASAGPLLIR